MKTKKKKHRISAVTILIIFISLAVGYISGLYSIYLKVNSGQYLGNSLGSPRLQDPSVDSESLTSLLMEIKKDLEDDLSGVSKEDLQAQREESEKKDKERLERINNYLHPEPDPEQKRIFAFLEFIRRMFF